MPISTALLLTILTRPYLTIMLGLCFSKLNSPPSLKTITDMTRVA